MYSSTVWRASQHPQNCVLGLDCRISQRDLSILPPPKEFGLATSMMSEMNAMDPIREENDGDELEDEADYPNSEPRISQSSNFRRVFGRTISGDSSSQEVGSPNRFGSYKSNPRIQFRNRGNFTTVEKIGK